ncbi:MAG: prephenate dehydratase domain-containing protein [Lachnospiraceae bacterium]
MEVLQELRTQLDDIDEQIIALYQQRMDICKQVGEDKVKTGANVFDKKRELEKLAKVSASVENQVYQKGITELFEQLMSVSRKLQYQLLSERGLLGSPPFIPVEQLSPKEPQVVFQGMEGAYSQAAMHNYFGSDVHGFHVDTFRGAMESIKDGTADFAVLPIENSSVGAVDQVYDLLVEFENYIVGEVIIPIAHTLSGLPGAKIEEVQQVYSHPQALMQSAGYLSNHPKWQQISVANTAVAAKKVLEDKDLSKAAICSEHAAAIYGLDILERCISDDALNSTRFIIVTNQKIFQTEASKISICFEVAHESGTLYHLLSHFIYNGLNMTKIESKPIAGQKWGYRFFVDFEGNMADGAVKNAIHGLQEEARHLKILGNY